MHQFVFVIMFPIHSYHYAHRSSRFIFFYFYYPSISSSF